MNQTYKFKPSLFQRKKNSFEYEQSLQKVIRFQIIPRLLSSHLKVCSRHVGNSYQSGLKITGFEISEFINLCITDNEKLSKDYIKRLISYGISTDQIFLELITPTAHLLGEKWDEDLLDFTQVTHGLVRLHSITHDIVANFLEKLAGKLFSKSQ